MKIKTNKIKSKTHDKRSKIFSLASKQAQEETNRVSVFHSKAAQEEMVGFAIIIVLVSVILLIFLVISSNQKETGVSSIKAQNFVQAFLQYTTDCENDLKHFTIQELVFECSSNNSCLDGRATCEVLNESLKGILNESWQIPPYKGYELVIIESNSTILKIKQGNVTRSYQGASQTLPKKGKDFSINFRIYN